jgi:hypothetical protein
VTRRERLATVAPMSRLLCLLAVGLALAVPAAALAQNDAFGPLPDAQSTDTPAPTATPVTTTSDEGTSRTTVLLIGGGLVALFAVITTVIVRDARRNVPEEDLRHGLRDEGPHQHKRQAKAKARAKARAARQARKRTMRQR